MSAEVQKQTSEAKAPPKHPFKAVRLVHSAPFNTSESDSIRMGPGQAERVYAARLEMDGSAVAIGTNQRADGLVFERDWFDRADGNKKKSERIFVAWSNIRCIVY